MNFVLVLLAFVCSLCAWAVALGWLHKGSWQEWIAAALAFFFLSLLVPWVEARRGVGA